MDVQVRVRLPQRGPSVPIRGAPGCPMCYRSGEPSNYRLEHSDMRRLDLCIRRVVVRRIFAFASVGLATLLGSCVHDGFVDRFQLKPDDVIIERRPDTAYEKLVPYYVELCAASQFHSKLTGEGGGPAGHAI